MTPTSSFFNRVVVSTGLIVSFTALAWADAAGFMGVTPAWWLLPILVLFAVGGVNELVHLFNAHDLLMPAWTLRGGVVATFLSVAFGTQWFVMKTGEAAPVAALSWALVAFTVAAGCLFVLEVIGYRPQGRSLERLAAGFFILAYLGVPMAFMVSLRLLCVENLGVEQRGPDHLGILPLVSMVAVVRRAILRRIWWGRSSARRRWRRCSALGRPGRERQHRWLGRRPRRGSCRARHSSCAAASSAFRVALRARLVEPIIRSMGDNLGLRPLSDRRRLVLVL